MVKKLYVFLFIALAALLAFGAPVTAASHPFEDVAERYEEAVSYFYSEEIIKGINDKEFGTYLNLKRGDAAVILAGALGLDIDNAPDAGFKDVNARVKNHVNALVHEGVIQGFNETEYRPDELLTRGQMAAVLVRAFNLGKYAKETPFTDLSETFKDDIEALYGAEITEGISETKYGTHEHIKRGDFVVLLYRTMNLDKEPEDPAVKSIKALDPIHVALGANNEELNLPKKVDVVFEDDTTGKRNVEWNTTELDTNIAKENELEGTVEGTTLKASLKVVVHSPAVEKPDDIVVVKDTSEENLQLPATVKLNFAGTSVERKVTWNTSNLDLTTTGDYQVDGAIERLSIGVTLKVTVSEIAVVDPDDIYVTKGTALEDVELPEKVRLNYPNGTYELKDVEWDTSELDLNTIGEYVLDGTIADTDLTANVKVIVNEGEYPEEVTLDKTSVNLRVGGKEKLTATITPSNVTHPGVTWSSNDENVATVDENGEVTAHALGYATITVKTADDKTATAIVSVVDEDLIPDLEVSAEVETGNLGHIRKIKLSINNGTPNSLELEKVEAYLIVGNTLRKTFTESKTIAPGETENLQYNVQTDYLFKNVSYVIVYFKLNDEIFEYRKNL